MKKEMTIQQAAQLTGYNESTLTRACQEGQIKARRAGRRWLVETPSLLEFGQRKPHKATRETVQENQLELPEKQPEAPDMNELAKQWEDDELQRIAEIYEKAEKEALAARNEGLQAIIPETRSARHTAPEDWKKVLIATYEDLLEQYHRGVAEGFRMAMAYLKEYAEEEPEE